MIGIYKIQNKLNGKCYIGQSIDISRRFKCHKNTAFNDRDACYKYPLYKAIRKYGIDNFSFDVLEKCRLQDLNNREEYWINVFNSYENGYNQTAGGDNSFSFKSKLDESDFLDIVSMLKDNNTTISNIAKIFGVGIDTISDINTGKSRFHDDIDYPIRANKKPQNKCCDCGVNICKNAKRCKTCSDFERRKVKHPTKEKLLELLVDNSMVSVGKMYGVSDKTIKKWLISE